MAKKSTKKSANKKVITGFVSPPKPKPSGKKTIKKSPKKTTSYIPKTKPQPAVSQKQNKKKTPKTQTQLTSQDLDNFRKILIDKLHEILGDVDWIENMALRKSRQDAAGDLSTMPIHMADLGTDNYEQEFTLGLMDSERKIVREILDALKRIALGTYGICEGTGQPIPRARLEANPWARYCVEYASMIEQGKVIENRYSGPLHFEEEDEEDTEHPDRDSDEEDTLFYDKTEGEEEGEDKTFADGLLYDDSEEEDEELL